MDKSFYLFLTIDPHIYDQLIVNKNAKVMWKAQAF